MLKNRAVVLFKPEVTYHTDPVPVAATNAILVENLDGPKPANARMYQRQPVRAGFAKLKPLYGGHLVELSFDVEVKGAASAGVAPELGPLLRACGFGETIVAVTSVTYKPASSSIISGTFYVFRDGKRQIITGARGQVKGSMEVGGAFKLSFTFVGHHVSESDVALASPTYTSVLPAPVLSAGFTFDSYGGIFTKLDFDMGIVLARPANINATDGYGEVQITDRNCTVKLDPEDVLVATYDFLTKWKNSTAMAFTTGVIGTGAGNRWQLSHPALTITEQMPAERDGGILVRELSCQAAESVSDDEISLAFT